MSGFIEAVIRHGGTEQAAHAAALLVEELLTQMSQEPDPDRRREHAGMVDAHSGERIGPITAGTRLGVGFTAQVERARELGVTGTIAIHTHPGSSSFSEADAAAFDLAPLIIVLVVAGANSTRYLLSLEPDATSPTKEEIKERYQQALDHLAPAYGALSYGGSLTEEQAWQELTHAIWEAISPGLGLRYDRVTPDEGLS